jgi:hypothetical protein
MSAPSPRSLHLALAKGAIYDSNLAILFRHSLRDRLA